MCTAAPGPTATGPPLAACTTTRTPWDTGQPRWGAVTLSVLDSSSRPCTERQTCLCGACPGVMLTARVGPRCRGMGAPCSSWQVQFGRTYEMRIEEGPAGPLFKVRDTISEGRLAGRSRS